LDERGSGTVLVLAVIAVVLTVLGGAMALGSTLIARHRAASAADLAALAAADRVLEGSVSACAAAAVIVAEHAAELVECRLAGDIVEVTVAVALPVTLQGLGPATARARAGPADSVTEDASDVMSRQSVASAGRRLAHRRRGHAGRQSRGA
jgi:secretion/DNA translocation related TadE-like protein